MIHKCLYLGGVRTNLNARKIYPTSGPERNQVAIESRSDDHHTNAEQCTSCPGTKGLRPAFCVSHGIGRSRPESLSSHSESRWQERKSLCDLLRRVQSLRYLEIGRISHVGRRPGDLRARYKLRCALSRFGYLRRAYPSGGPHGGIS